MSRPQTDYAFASADEYYRQDGLTKREYIATQLMAALCSHPSIALSETAERLAWSAVNAADALLKELEKATGAEVGND